MPRGHGNGKRQKNIGDEVGLGEWMRKIKKIDGACAVCALQYVSGIDEETVLRVCAMHGFEVGEGMADQEYLEAAADLKLTLKKVKTDRPLLRHFIKKYPTGLFLVATYGHLFAVDNGIVADPRNEKRPGLRRIVESAWLVKPRKSP